MEHLKLLAKLAQPNDTKLVLLVLDGLGDLRTEAQPRTALELATIPNLDHLAGRSALGRLIPVSPGITPGSGPGHLALFGYDPLSPATEIGRGVLEALGSGLAIKAGDVAVRGNFATADRDGHLTDRRAGRIPTEECLRLVQVMRSALAQGPDLGLTVEIEAGEAHRFVMVLKGSGLCHEISDTDPQRLGVAPLPPQALSPAAASTVERLNRALPMLAAAIAGEPKANRFLLRGFSVLPQLPPMNELYRLRLGAFAGYPLYRGVAGACGMEVVPCGKRIGDILSTVEANWQRFDFFFLHVKQTDQAGEDGNLAAKAQVLEEVDHELPRLLSLGADVVAVTGDHSTPAPLAAHSWHPVPLLMSAPHCFVDGSREFSEAAASRGHLGTFPAYHLMALMLANAGRLAKFGA